MKRYHGWIVTEKENGFRPSFSAELTDETNRRSRPITSYSPAEVVDWWDTKIGHKVSLEETPIGYRVYTEESHES